MELRTDRLKLKKLFPDKAKKYAQKLHKKASEIEFIRKGIPIDPEDIEIKEGERAAIRLITTPHLDRDGEILIPSGAILDDFRQSPSVLYGHDYKSLPVGSDQWVKQVKEGILAKTVYAKHQFAEDVYQCVIGKHLNSNSVGFIPVEAVNQEEDKKAFAEWQGVLEKDYGIDKKESGKAKAIYTKWIMLEHSDVPVASNAQSLNLAVGKGELVIKSPRLKKDLEIEVVKDKEIEVVRDFATGKLEVIKEGDNDKKEKEIKGEKKAETGTEEEKETIKIEEITEEVTEDIAGLLTIENKEKLSAKVIEVIKKYDINEADVFGQFTAGNLVKAIEQKRKVKLSFDKDGNIAVTKPDKDEAEEKPLETEEKQDDLMSENQKNCEHKWADAAVKDGKDEKEYICVKCGLIIEKLPLGYHDVDEFYPTAEEEAEKAEESVRHLDPGQAGDILGALLQVKNGLAELKEGRVLSTKNRTLVKDVRDLIRELDEKLTSLLDATEPTSREEEKIVDRKTEKQYIIEKGDKQPDLDERLAKAVEKVLSGDNLKKLFDKSLEEAVDIKIKKKMGKVE